MGNKIKLAELEPKLSDNYLNFLCPICIKINKESLHYGHRIVIPTTRDNNVYNNNSKIWMVSGKDINDVSIQPSIATVTKNIEGECSFHGWVKNGEVTW